MTLGTDGRPIVRAPGQGCTCTCPCHDEHMNGKCINHAQSGTAFCFGCLSQPGCRRDFRPEIAAKELDRSKRLAAK